MLESLRELEGNAVIESDLLILNYLLAISSSPPPPVLSRLSIYNVATCHAPVASPFIHQNF